MAKQRKQWKYLAVFTFSGGVINTFIMYVVVFSSMGHQIRHRMNVKNVKQKTEMEKRRIKKNTERLKEDLARSCSFISHQMAQRHTEQTVSIRYWWIGTQFLNEILSLSLSLSHWAQQKKTFKTIKSRILATRQQILTWNSIEARTIQVLFGCIQYRALQIRVETHRCGRKMIFVFFSSSTYFYIKLME